MKKYLMLVLVLVLLTVSISASILDGGGVTSLYSNGKYLAFGITIKSNDTIFAVYREGTSHASPGDYGIIRQINSTNNGITWGSPVTIISESGVDLRNVGGGITSTGRIIIFYYRYNPDTLTEIGSSYVYTDNNGNSWSAPIPLNIGSPYGGIVESNGILIQPVYGNNNASIIRSLDNGLTWSSIINIFNSSVSYLQPNEPSVINIGCNRLISLTRLENSNTFRQARSSDNGLTWIDQGNTVFETFNGVPTPAWLSLSGINQKYVVAHYTNRITNGDEKVIEAKAEDLFNSGVSAWDNSTKRILFGLIGLGMDNGYPSVVNIDGYTQFGWIYSGISSLTNIQFFEYYNLGRDVNLSNVRINNWLKTYELSQNSTPYSYWKFDGGVYYSDITLYDEITTNNDDGILTNFNKGTNNGSSGWNTTNCKYVSCLSFDGVNDRISIPSSINKYSFIQNTGNFTISGWLNIRNPSIVKDQTILSTAAASAEKGFYFAYANGAGENNQLRIMINKGTTGQPIVNAYSNVDSYTSSGYHYVTVVGNGTNIVFYIDGIRDGSINTMTSLKSSGDSTHDLTIGTFYYPSAYYDFLEGSIDELRIYNYSLTNDEINQIMINTLKSSGNMTTWYDATIGYKTYQVTVNATTEANSNYTVWYANNGTGEYSQLGETLIGNNTIAISGVKYQNTDVQVRLAGNTTSTPEIMPVVFWTQAVLPDTSFTVTLPSGITQAFFNATNNSSKNVNASGQNVTAGFFYITNTGNVALDFYAIVNSSQPAGVALKGSTDNNPAGESVVPIDASLVKIIDAIPVCDCQYFWLWVDYSNASPMAEQRLLSVNSSQS